MTGTIGADWFGLDRFVSAQEVSYARVLTELRRGLKTSHWMWFVFPQVAGLGSSEMSRRYALGSIAEAQAYLAHPLLGARYRECVAVLQDLVATTAEAVFGRVDAAKLRSSLTLFAEAAGDPLFAAAIQRWFGAARTSVQWIFLAPVCRLVADWTSGRRVTRVGYEGNTGAHSSAIRCPKPRAQ